MLRWWNSGNPRNTAGLVNKESRGGGRERYGGRQSPPKIHAGPGAFFPRCDPCPPRSGRLQHLSKPLQDPAQYSPFRQEVASGSGSQTGRGGSKGGDVCAVGGGCRCVTPVSDGEFEGWEPRAAGKSSHGRKRRRNRVGVESPLPKINSPAPATFWPRERK